LEQIRAVQNAVCRAFESTVTARPLFRPPDGLPISAFGRLLCAFAMAAIFGSSDDSRISCAAILLEICRSMKKVGFLP
jgi:hypothetical protein